MKAWERELAYISEAKPTKDQEKKEENWITYLENGISSDKKLFKDWISFVPGSLAPCHLIIGAIQSMENKGYDVNEAELLIDEGLKLAEEKNGAELQILTAKIYKILNDAKKNIKSKYWNYKIYTNFKQIEENTTFPEKIYVDINTKEFKEKIYCGWMGQLIGGAIGTQIEGYTMENIKEVFGNVDTYLRPPETYNDDITYALAFLDAFFEKGYNVTSKDIAYKWLYFIPDGYSAEEIALKNLRNGIFPPESGTLNNYYSDWIGVQMRTMIHGMVSPGNPKMAAELSIKDGIISHSNSGILGGMFNAVLLSLSFTEKNVAELLCKTIDMIPKNSEYFSVISLALKECKKNSSWEDSWKNCIINLKEYHWIHAYPNVVAEIIALWYGREDFDKTANIIAMIGMDVDCTAAPILSALAILKGKNVISEKWILPLGEEIKTFMRKENTFSLDYLINKTIDSIIKANC